MNTEKLIKQSNFILLFFYLLPISFILGNAVLELNIILIVITFLKEIINDKSELKKIFKSKLFITLLLFWIYLNCHLKFFLHG